MSGHSSTWGYIPSGVVLTMTLCDSIIDLMEVFAEHPNLAGLNVTIPYKQQVMAYLNDIDPVAQRIGAVNVIRTPVVNPGF